MGQLEKILGIIIGAGALYYIARKAKKKTTYERKEKETRKPAQPKPVYKPTPIQHKIPVADPIPNKKYYDGIIVMERWKATYKREYTPLRIDIDDHIFQIIGANRANIIDITTSCIEPKDCTHPRIPRYFKPGSLINIRLEPVIFADYGISDKWDIAGFKGMNTNIKIPNTTDTIHIILYPFRLVRGYLVTKQWFKDHLEKVEVVQSGYGYLTRIYLYVDPNEIAERKVFYYRVDPEILKRISKANSYVIIEPKTYKGEKVVYVNHDYAWRGITRGKIVIELISTMQSKPYPLGRFTDKVWLVFKDGEYPLTQFIQ